MRLLAVLLFTLHVCLAGVVPPDLDAWVERARKTFEVPGMAVAIVKDGQVIVSKGYGVRKLGSPEPVDEHTVFGIASNSKAFATGTLALLVDEGKLSWDDPVQKHLPEFAMYDPFVSRELTIRDLVSHRSGLGLGAGDLLFWPDTDVTRAEVVAATRQIRPASSLRSRYAYNNLLFVVAGQVVERVSGKPWDQFVRERIFTPLGMKESTITSAGLAGNVAQPHSRGWRLEGKLTPVAMTKDDTWAAAAGVKSNLVDLARWVTANLDKPLWSEKQRDEMWSPHTIVPVSRGRGALAALRPHFSAYGLGWSLRDYKGRKLVSHGGALTGMLTTIYLVPEERLGIIVLTNQEEGGAMASVVWHVLDEAFGLPKTDWIEAYQAARKETLDRAKAAEAKLAAARARDSKPSLPLTRYAAEYTDPWYGKAVIAHDNGSLTLRMTRTPSMTGTLEHWQHDTFKVRWQDKTIPDAFVSFVLDYKGGIESVKMRPVSSLADFSFDYEDLLFRPITK